MQALPPPNFRHSMLIRLIPMLILILSSSHNRRRSSRTGRSSSRARHNYALSLLFIVCLPANQPSNVSSCNRPTHGSKKMEKVMCEGKNRKASEKKNCLSEGWE